MRSNINYIVSSSVCIQFIMYVALSLTLSLIGYLPWDRADVELASSNQKVHLTYKVTNNQFFFNK